MIYKFQIQYVAVDESGNDKQMKENYVTEQFNMFSEVENFALEYFSAFTDIDVVEIKRDARIKEIANSRSNGDDMIWEAVVQETFLIEDKEKKSKYRMLLFAPSFDSAKAFITEYMKQGYNDMKLVSLKLTKYIDVL